MNQAATQPKTAPTPVTIEGRKGMKSVPFRKTFKSEAALEAWMDKNGGDVSVDRYSYN